MENEKKNVNVGDFHIGNLQELMTGETLIIKECVIPDNHGGYTRTVVITLK